MVLPGDGTFSRDECDPKATKEKKITKEADKKHNQSALVYFRTVFSSNRENCGDAQKVQHLEVLRSWSRTVAETNLHNEIAQIIGVECHDDFSALSDATNFFLMNETNRWSYQPPQTATFFRVQYNVQYSTTTVGRFGTVIRAKQENEKHAPTHIRTSTKSQKFMFEAS